MKEKVTEAQFEQLEQQIWLEFLNSASPLDIHKSVITSNWDGNDFLLNWIKDNPNTDKGTILLTYWRASPRWNKQFLNRDDLIEKQGWGVDNFDFIEDIEAKYCNGFYKNENIFFDPKHGVEGDDWTKENLDIAVVREIPELMFKPTNGDLAIFEHPDDFDDGLPMRPIDYAQRVWDLFDSYEIIY